MKALSDHAREQLLTELILEARASKQRGGAAQRVITCVCGRGFVTELTEGTVTCACGKYFSLDDRRRLAWITGDRKRR